MLLYFRYFVWSINLLLLVDNKLWLSHMNLSTFTRFSQQTHLRGILKCGTSQHAWSVTIGSRHWRDMPCSDSDIMWHPAMPHETSRFWFIRLGLVCDARDLSEGPEADRKSFGVGMFVVPFASFCANHLNLFSEEPGGVALLLSQQEIPLWTVCDSWSWYILMLLEVCLKSKTWKYEQPSHQMWDSLRSARNMESGKAQTAD